MASVTELDRGGAAHAVCALDRGSGAVIDRFEARHDAGGLRDMERRLARHGAPEVMPVAAIVVAGLPVVPIHPNAVKALRPRYRASGAKDDRGDAYLLADLLRAAPRGLADPAEADAKGEMVRALGAVLALLVARIIDLTARIRHEVAASEDGRILMSFPQAGQRCAAQILAELGEDRARYLTPDQRAADAGLAPVTRKSGKSRGASFRWACNRRLRAALTCFADNSRHACAWSARIYAIAPGRGCRHPHAIRILGRAWLRVLWRAWQDRKPYDPTLHGTAKARG